MSQTQRTSAAQFRADRLVEQGAVITTIVGGRPPGSGQPVGNIPRGIEVLVKKAAVDRAFKAVLMERRAAAAQEIGLELKPAEAAMLGAVPAGQLEAIIGGTVVPLEHRRAFLGRAAAAMLAVLGVGAAAMAADPPVEVAGVRAVPNRTEPKPTEPKEPPKTVEERVIAVAEKQFQGPDTPARPGQPLVVAGVRIMPAKVQITRLTSLAKDLGATQPGLLKFKQALDQEFDIFMVQADFDKVETAGEVVDLVEKTLKDKAAGIMVRPEPGPMISLGIRIQRPLPPVNPPNP